MCKKISCFVIVLLVLFVGSKTGFCYKIPSSESNIRYLYVFGKEGKKGFGAKKEPQVLFFRVPGAYTGKIEISIYDPDVGGAVDEKSKNWNTATNFSIFGGEGAYSSLAGKKEAEISNFNQGVLLESIKFAANKKYDKKLYSFPPLDATQGERIGDYRYFKFVAEGLSGDDNNIFSLEVSPDVVEAFGYILSIRLSEQSGTKMRLYPEIPQGATKIIEYNYDVDQTGGEIQLVGPSMSYKLNGSGTGVWTNTKIDVPSTDGGRRWLYEITKGTQPNANMAVYFTSGEGKPIPIFWTSKGKELVAVPEPITLCNTFTFDASKSYDPDNQRLKFFWDLGDGTTSNESKIKHTYKEVGKYLVKLTVSDDSTAECNSATTQQIVNVNLPPQAVAKGPSISCVDSEVIFDAGESKDTPGDKLTWTWDFGDGNSGEGQKLSHKYAKGGNYQVTLKVMDDSGSTCDTGVDKLNIFVNTPPVADAGEKEVVLCKRSPDEPLEVVFDGSNSKDADGDRLSWTWNFGDGSTAEGKTVTHAYEKGGEYIAKLIVSDRTPTNCNESIATKLVTLNRAPMANAGEDRKICLNDEVNFDAGLSSDSDGDTLTYIWDFGDGEIANGVKVSHRFTKGGIYKVGLSVDDNTKTECSDSSDMVVVDVNSSPDAKIIGRDSSCAGESVDFDGSLSMDPDGDILTWTWDFGDGTTANGETAQHKYSKGGLYRVTLLVDDGKNLNCSTSRKTHYININTPPTADAGADKVICVNKMIEFDASKSLDPDNDSLKYVWDFGDGVSQEGLKVSHSYSKIGTYKAVLTVTDSSGTTCNTSIDTLVVTVNAHPVPVIEVVK